MVVATVGVVGNDVLRILENAREGSEELAWEDVIGTVVRAGASA